MKRLIQELNLEDDSFSYTILGEEQPTYKVNSSGYLTEKGVRIGRFKLDSYYTWNLYINDCLFMEGPPSSLFSLPEFELKALTKFINKEEPK